jgi:membrane-associated phospholipid phosphatase
MLSSGRQTITALKKETVLFELLETGLGLDIVLALQSTRSGFLDTLTILLHGMGGESFYLIIVSMVYWSLNRHLGARLIFMVLAAGILNTLLKECFHRPRPDMVSTLVVPVVNQEGYGFPSAHVMVSLAVWGYAAVYLQRRWLYMAVGLYTIVMAWSRMYAGVHYPHDVMAGALFGLLTLGLYMRLAEPVVKRWGTLKPAMRAGTMTALGLAAAFVLSHDPIGLALAGILIGLGPAIELENRLVRFAAQDTPAHQVLRYGIGFVLTLALFFGLRMLFGAQAAEGTVPWVGLRLLRFAAITLFACFLWPWLALRLGIARRSESKE